MPEDKRPTGPEPGGPPENKRPPVMRALFPWAVLFVCAIVIMTFVSRLAESGAQALDMNQLRGAIEDNKVLEVVLHRDRITGKKRGAGGGPPTSFVVTIIESQGENFDRFITDHNDRVRAEDRNSSKIVKYKADRGNEFLQIILVQFLPYIILFVFFWWLISRQFRAPGGPGGVLSFGKSRAKMHMSERVAVTFDDVAGIEEAKEDVQEIVEFLMDPKRFTRLGARIPRGVLLVGSPGTGKTLLAKAIAGEASVPFFSISGSDFVEMFVGVGASRVRDLFREAKEHGPSIIFLDEIDAVGRRRGAGLGGGHDEREQTLNAILVEMDGFEREANVIVIAATNRPDVLDPALRRPGRFDRIVVVDLPDIRGREQILRVHSKNYKLSPDVDLNRLARGTPTFSGADLEAVMNEAALAATKAGKETVENSDLERARDKVRWGREKRSRVMDEEDRRITAVHESGHALAAVLLSEVEPLHKVSIVSQGMALGMTMSLPEKDVYHHQRKKLLGQICMMLAGRAAEEEFCDDISTGAAQDLASATDLARSMVCRWGMSESLGPVAYHEPEETVFLGREITRTRTHSEAMAVRIDQEIRNILTTEHERARELIHANGEAVQRVADALMKHEVLYRADVEQVIEGKELPEDPGRSGTGADSAPAESAGQKEKDEE